MAVPKGEPEGDRRPAGGGVDAHVIHERAHQTEAVALSPEAPGLPAAVILNLDDQIRSGASSQASG